MNALKVCSAAALLLFTLFAPLAFAGEMTIDTGQKEWPILLASSQCAPERVSMGRGDLDKGGTVTDMNDTGILLAHDFGPKDLDRGVVIDEHGALGGDVGVEIERRPPEARIEIEKRPPEVGVEIEKRAPEHEVEIERHYERY